MRSLSMNIHLNMTLDGQWCLVFWGLDYVCRVDFNNALIDIGTGKVFITSDCYFSNLLPP